MSIFFSDMVAKLPEQKPLWTYDRKPTKIYIPYLAGVDWEDDEELDAYTDKSKAVKVAKKRFEEECRFMKYFIKELILHD